MKLPLLKISFLFCLLLSLSNVQAQKHEWLRATKSSLSGIPPTSIDSDSSSSPYISGFFHTNDSINFHTGTGNKVVYDSKIFDLFQLKLDSSGNYQWTNIFGGRSEDFIYDSHIDNKNNIFIAGSFRDTIQFSDSSSNASLVEVGFYDGFVAKFDQDGKHLWSFSIGGVGMDQIRKINTDSKNNIYLVGYFTDSVDMDPGIAEHFVYSNPSKQFILKLDSAGNFKWVRLFNITIGNIGINKFDHIYFSANLTDTSSITTQSGVETLIPKGNNDLLFGRMDSKGGIKWINQLQSNHAIKTSGYINSISYEDFPTDNNGNLYLFGTFSNSVNLLNKPNGLHHSQGKTDGFICKFDTSGNEIWLKTFGGKKHENTMGVTMDNSNNIYLGIESSGSNMVFQTDSGIVSVKELKGAYIMQFNPNGNFEWAKAIKGRLTMGAIDWNPSNDIYSTGNFDHIEFKDSVYSGGYASGGGYANLFIAKTKICNPIPYYDTLYLCAGDTSFISDLKTEHAGNYSELVQNDFGCDSLRLTHLVVYPSYPDTTFYSFCEGDSLFYQGNYYSEDTVFVYPATTVLGCDSSKIVLIQKDTTVITEIMAQICEGDTFNFDNQSYTESGIYIDTLTAISGCDSVVNIDLTVNPITKSQQSISICEGKNWKVGDSYYYEAGTYIDTLSSHLGCDSIVTTIITVDSLPKSEQFVTMCQGGNYTIGNSTYGQTGTYTDTLDRFHQCDSIVTTHISIAQNADSTINVEFCEGDSAVINDQVYRESGTFNQTFDFVNCQLKLTINVNVLAVKRKTQTFDLCVGDSVRVGNDVYGESGTYYYTFQSTNGCDSIVETKLNIPEFDVILDENSLSVSSKDDYENVRFLWYNCDSKRILHDEKDRRFEYKFTGKYAPIVILDGCRDTLICNQVTYDGDYELKVFPNPAKDVCTIAVPTAGKIRLLNSKGNLVKEQYFNSSREYIYQINNLATGIYFIVFEGEKGVLTEKLSIVK